MSRTYEAVYIFDSALEETAITQRLEQHHSHLHQADSEAISLDVWGKRTLAYPINGKETGYYVIAKFDATPDQLPEFERSLKLDEGLLRHLVVLDEGAQMSKPNFDSDEGDD